MPRAHLAHFLLQFCQVKWETALSDSDYVTRNRFMVQKVQIVAKTIECYPARKSVEGDVACGLMHYRYFLEE